MANAVNYTQDVLLMIRRFNITIFVDVKNNVPLLHLKKIVEGILKVPPQQQILCLTNGTRLRDDTKTLRDYGLGRVNATIKVPFTLGLVLKTDIGWWETLEITPFSTSPQREELPIVTTETTDI